MPVPSNIGELYNIPPDSYWKKDYLETDNGIFRYEIKKLSSLLNSFEGKRVLDVGAGVGKCMRALENVGFEVYGLEPSETFYNKTITMTGISHERLKLSPVENANFEDNHFDFITFGAVLKHLQDPSSAIIKAIKWLKPNGIIHIEVPSSDWLVHKLVNYYYSFFSKGYVANLSPMHLPYHLYEFSFNSFKKHSEKNNYSIIAHEYFVCQTYMPKMLDVLLRNYIKWTDTGMQLSIWLKKFDT